MNPGPLDLQSNALPLSYTPFLHNGFSIPYFKCVTTPKHSIATVNSIHSSPPLKLAKPPQTDWSPFSGHEFTFAAPEAPPLSKRYLSILVATTLPAAGREAPCLRTRAFRVETPPPQRSSSLSSSPSSSDPAPRSAPASLPQPPSFPDPPRHTQLSRPGARLKRCPRG